MYSSQLLVRAPSRRRGFSLVELLVVIAMIGILAALTSRGIYVVARSSRATSCVANLKQLELGSHLYANDHNDFLPPNKWSQIEWTDGCPQGYSSANGSWVLGEASTERTDTGIRHGVLFPYVKNVSLYHCPEDRSKAEGTRDVLRKRSYSASYYMNGSKDTGYPQVKAKYSEINDPSKKFVYLDEHANTIDDGVFFLHMPGDYGEQTASHYVGNHYHGAHWMSMPSDRHNKSSNLAYADGSVLPHKWRWPKTMKTPASDRNLVNEYDFTDFRWLQSGIPDVNLEWTVAANANGPGHKNAGVTSGTQ